jgi:hypothetical protein
LVEDVKRENGFEECFRIGEELLLTIIKRGGIL